MKQALKLIIFLSLYAFIGCKKKKPDPVAPVIAFERAQLSEDRSFAIVTFSFFDGDGDLGLKQDENTGENEFNLLVDYYEKVNGIWMLKSPIVTWNNNENRYDTTELNLRVPFIENNAETSLEGETTVDLLYNFAADTFKYELTLKDRALQLSNTIETDEIVVN